jgi:hypothetical protein
MRMTDDDTLSGIFFLPPVSGDSFVPLRYFVASFLSLSSTFSSLNDNDRPHVV